jgi:hypothetical protein
MGIEDLSAIEAQLAAWGAASANHEFPVIYDWELHTGENAEFESLVKLLEPRVIDARVGIRDMDGTTPGFGMTNGADLGLIPTPPDNQEIPTPTVNQEIIGLEGALKAPTAKSRPESIDPTKPCFGELAEIVNAPAEVKATSDDTEDPLIAPPIYGENHANDHSSTRPPPAG